MSCLMMRMNEVIVPIRIEPLEIAQDVARKLLESYAEHDEPL